MLRKIVGTRRRIVETVDSNSDSASLSSLKGSSFSGSSTELEPWLEYLQRSTRNVEGYMKEYSIREWVETLYRYKLRLAGHIGRRTDGRWSKRALYRRPPEGLRGRGHPNKRWSDDLDEFFWKSHGLLPGGWLDLCSERESWQELSDAFVEHCMS